MKTFLRDQRRWSWLLMLVPLAITRFAWSDNWWLYLLGAVMIAAGHSAAGMQARSDREWTKAHPRCPTCRGRGYVTFEDVFRPSETHPDHPAQSGSPASGDDV